MMPPLVTVVCLCYNHEKFVREAIESVFNQTHLNTQLIVIDDASTDKSTQVIKNVLKDHPEVPFISLSENKGNCKAFNTSLSLIKGEFVIDLAADDVLLPERVEEGVKQFHLKGNSYGIHFSDAEIISEEGSHLGFHSDRFPHDTIPEGDVYIQVIRKYFISPPSVMMRKEVLNEMNGYDETLAYEDFDLWVRASRDFKFTYTGRPLVRKREVRNSLGNQQFKRSGNQLRSTYKVCEKILILNQKREERTALRKRIVYEIGITLRLVNFKLMSKYLLLFLRNELRAF